MAAVAPALNLLRNPWIPVRRRSGADDMIGPAQITERLEEDPVVAIASPRADFDGALVQFLIGLLQTLCPPPDGRAWRKWFDDPPSPAELGRRWEEYDHAFELLGEGPRFLQDLELSSEDQVNNKPIGKLLIDHGLSKGKDHFVKWGDVQALSPEMAACALLTLQINAPSGGRGHRTGIRGGGPLTTLVMSSESLWSTLWLNVGPFDHFAHEIEELGDVFPWMAPTRTSENGEVTTNLEAHPLQVFWAMPRRIVLDSPREGVCSLLPTYRGPVIEGYLDRHGGVNYEGAWEHPLTPYYEAKKEEWLPRHGKGARIGYDDWLGLVQEDRSGGRGAKPAKVVSLFRGEPARARRTSHGFRLWAFGYDMDSMKPRAWTEGTMPLDTTPEEEDRERFENDVERLVSAARKTCSLLLRASKEAIADESRGGGGPLRDLEKRFWEDTEGEFFELLQRVLEAGADSDAAMALRRGWHRTLCNCAEELFHAVVTTDRWDAMNPRQIVQAHAHLMRNLRGPNMREKILALPPKDKDRDREEPGTTEEVST